MTRSASTSNNCALKHLRPNRNLYEGNIIVIFQYCDCMIYIVFGAAFFIGLFFALKWAPLDWFYPVLYYVQVCEAINKA